MEKLRIVIAEDDLAIAKAFRRMLESLGHEVVALAGNGQQAVQFVHTYRPDVVLLDVRMPGVDGIEAARRITAEAPTPIVMVTAHDDAATVERASAAGAYGYVVKPTDMEELDRVLTVVRRRFLELQEVRRLRQEAEENATRLAMLNAIAAAVSQLLDLDETLAIALESILKVMDLSVGAVHVLDEEKGELVLRTGQGISPDYARVIDRFKLGESITGLAAQSGEAILVDDVARDARLTRREALEHGLRSLACIPLRAKDRVVGVLSVSSKNRSRPFSEQDAELLTAIAHQVGVAVENARLYHDLQVSEKKYRGLVENSTDFVFIVDDNGEFIFANTRSEELLGYAPDELVGRDIGQLIHPDDAERVMAEFRAAVVAGRDPRAVEYRVRHRDGGYRDHYTTATFVLDEQGNQVGLQGVGRDVTERNRLQFQLRQSEKLAAVGQLVSGVAHELNNPLTTVVGYSQLLQRADVPSEVQRKLASIYKEARRCARIVGNLQTFAQQREMEPAHVSINEIIEAVLELQGYRLRVNDIEVIRELDESLPRTMADPHQLQHVLIHLITNAEQAMTQEFGGGRLTVRSKLVDGEIIRLEVADEGPGIPEAIRNRIFDPFFTTREVGQGTGLGLSLCFGIVQEHEGRIWVENNCDLYNDPDRQGATFFVELPVRGMDTEWAEALLAEQHAIDEGQAILVVEDEKGVARLLQDILESTGYWVTLAENGEDALQKLSEGEYDAIITDLKMPGMSGQELAAHLAEHQPDMAQRLVFVSGDLASAEARAFLAGVSDLFISKPFDVDTVVEVVGRACAGG